MAALTLAGCQTPGPPHRSMAHATPRREAMSRREAKAEFPNIGYATWTDEEPPYRVYPGDELDISVPSAPELDKTLIVQPDGRISLPLIHTVMVADRTVGEVEQTLDQAYSSQLLRPEVFVSVKTATPLKVFVGGEVDKPGVYDMPGDINALQAVIQAGGFKSSAKRGDVIIIRRGPDGRPMMRTANLRRGLDHPGKTDLVPLRRFDVVYVPRTGLADAGVFVQQLNGLVPSSIGFSYLLNNSSAVPIF